MDTQPGEGRRVVAQYRRVLYEVLEELSDSVWWTFVIVYAVALLWVFVGPRSLGLLAIAVIPIGQFVAELMRWRNEVFTIYETGKGYDLTKRWGIFRTREISDALDGLAYSITQGPIGKLFGFESVHLSSAKQGVFLDGKRMPVAFRRKIEQLRDKKPAVHKVENDQLALWERIQDSMATGYLPKHVGQDAILRILGEMVYGPGDGV